MIEVQVNAEGHGDVPIELLTAAVRLALLDQGVGAAEVCVTLLGDAAIADLNDRYLGRDRPTDVIAFSLGGPGVLGDVYLGIDQARRQAEEHGVDLSEELVRLAIHGTLHALGHDHPAGSDRVESPMFRLQERLVSSLLAAPRRGPE